MMSPTLPVAGNRESLLISLFFLAISISLFGQIHLWVLLLCVCAAVVRLCLYSGLYNHMPGKRMVNLLALLAGVALVTTSEGTDFLRIMINLLLMACSLKLMLLSKRRDFFQLFICGIFLLACGIIFYQSPGRSLFYAIMLVVLIFILFSAHNPSAGLPFRQRKTLVLLLQALPLAVLLFVFMPRIPPLWKMPEGKSTETGLAETMTPGDIANLAQSEDLAFSARFSDPIPAQENRYWRAMTLEHFDGRSWSASETRLYARAELQQLKREFMPAISGPPSRYEVITEPTQKTWLYALDTAVPDSAASRQDIWQGWNYQLSATEPVYNRFAYQVASYPETRKVPSNLSLDTAINSQVPESGNLLTREWVAKLRQQHVQDKAFATALMRYFAFQGFEYTLTPPPMLTDPVDSFMFEHKVGFCAHYASAMAYSFRLAGIPARIVSGYQGGTPIDDETINVYQYDAHAWVEALIDGHWQNFDPTTVVAPSRIMEGFEHAARFSDEMQGEHPLNGISHWQVFKYVRNLNARMDYLWNRWFLGFDNKDQGDVLKRLLGDLSTLRVSLFSFGLLGLAALLLVLYFVPDWRRKRIPQQNQLYLQAVTAIEKTFKLNRDNRSPRQFYDYCRDSLPPRVTEALLALTHAYESFEYAEDQAQGTKQIKMANRAVHQALRDTYPR